MATRGRLPYRPARTVALLLGLTTCWAPAQAGIQSLEAIRASVERYVRTEFSALGEISAVEVSALDPRLQLAACEQPLEPFTPAGQRRLGHATIGIRCSGERPWTLYVPVRIESTVKIMTAARALPRGKILTPDDIKPVVRDVAALPYGYFTSADILTGQKLKRAVRPGEVLSPTMVAPAPLVERGQIVWIATKASGIEVRMQGEALADGAAGERINVRNLSSRRILEAEVVDNGLVQVPW